MHSGLHSTLTVSVVYGHSSSVSWLVFYFSVCSWLCRKWQVRIILTLYLLRWLLHKLLVAENYTGHCYQCSDSTCVSKRELLVNLSCVSEGDIVTGICCERLCTCSSGMLNNIICTYINNGIHECTLSDNNDSLTRVNNDCCSLTYNSNTKFTSTQDSWVDRASTFRVLESSSSTIVMTDPKTLQTSVLSTSITRPLFNNSTNQISTSEQTSAYAEKVCFHLSPAQSGWQKVPKNYPLH